MPSRTVDFEIFDADNHMYETKEALTKFLPDPAPLQDRVGQLFQVERDGHAMDVIPLPHPSGRSTWLVRPENQERLDRALDLLAGTRGWRETFGE